MKEQRGVSCCVPGGGGVSVPNNHWWRGGCCVVRLLWLRDSKTTYQKSEGKWPSAAWRKPYIRRAEELIKITCLKICSMVLWVWSEKNQRWSHLIFVESKFGSEPHFIIAEHRLKVTNNRTRGHRTVSGWIISLSLTKVRSSLSAPTEFAFPLHLMEKFNITNIILFFLALLLV